MLIDRDNLAAVGKKKKLKINPGLLFCKATANNKGDEHK